MKVSSNAKQGTDKTRKKFWEDIHIHYDKLITTSNKINESNAKNISLECCNIQSQHNSWQRRLTPAVQ
jgi:hypothetical protein